MAIKTPRLTSPKTVNIDDVVAQIASDYRRGVFNPLPAGILLSDVMAKMAELHPNIPQSREPLPADLQADEISSVIADSAIMPGKGRQNGTLYFYVPCTVGFEKDGSEQEISGVRVLCPRNMETIGKGFELTDNVTVEKGEYNGREVVNLRLSL